MEFSIGRVRVLQPPCPGYSNPPVPGTFMPLATNTPLSLAYCRAFLGLVASSSLSFVSSCMPRPTQFNLSLVLSNFAHLLFLYELNVYAPLTQVVILYFQAVTNMEVIVSEICVFKISHVMIPCALGACTARRREQHGGCLGATCDGTLFCWWMSDEEIWRACWFHFIVLFYYQRIVIFFLLSLALLSHTLSFDFT